MIKSIIIESSGCNMVFLRKHLSSSFNEVVRLKAYTDFDMGLEAIKKWKPSLVFIDMSMPLKSDYSLSILLKKNHFDIVFVTKKIENLIFAFNIQSISYLLVPFDLADIQKLVRGLIQKRKSKKVSRIIKQKKANNISFKKLALPTNEGLIFIELANIIRCQAESNYTCFYLPEEKIVVAKTMKIYCDILEQYNFFRISRSCLINLDWIQKFGRQKGPTIQLTNGKILNVSPSRKKDLLERIRIPC